MGELMSLQVGEHIAGVIVVVGVDIIDTSLLLNTPGCAPS